MPRPAPLNAPPRPAPLPRTILAILTASPFSLYPHEIASKINSGRAEFNEKPVSGDTVRSVLRRLVPRVEAMGAGRWRVGAGHPLEREMRLKEGVPLRPPSVSHCGRLSLSTPCSRVGIDALHDVLDKRFLASFSIPRIDAPREGDRAKQHIFHGSDVRVVICEGNGKTTIYPKSPRWKIEFKEFFPPELYLEASTKKPSYSHEEFPKQQLERYLYSGGELTIETEGSQFPEGDYSIQGNHEDIQTAKASLSLKARSEAITIEMQLREEQKRLTSQVEELSKLVLVLSKSLSPLSKGDQGGMFG